MGLPFRWMSVFANLHSIARMNDIANELIEFGRNRFPLSVSCMVVAATLTLLFCLLSFQSVAARDSVECARA